MKYLNVLVKIILAVLVFLAVSSGVMKMMLIPQEVEFFGNFGFTNSILIAFGAAQLIGGILLIFLKTRILGAAIVAITFMISAVVLTMSGNIPLTIVTLVAVLMLIFVATHSIGTGKRDRADIIR